MELPDFLSYKDKFSTSGFVEKISRIAKRAGVKLVYSALILYYTLESDKVSTKEKAIILDALGYLISPLDLVPDAIPIAGLSDDLAVLLYVIHKIWGNVSDDIKLKAKNKLSKWFDNDEIKAVDHLFDDDPTDTPV
ncbi:MAG: YkvA family protein [Prevotella sp.]